MTRILLSRGFEIAGEMFAGLTVIAAVLALWLCIKEVPLCLN